MKITHHLSILLMVLWLQLLHSFADSHPSPRSLRPKDAPRILRTVRDQTGEMKRCHEGVVLVKFRREPFSRKMIVRPGSEVISAQTFSANREVEFAELDVVLKRQFDPNDRDLPQQWHHRTIHSFAAWSVSLATHKVNLAILDNPFQMNHPDLLGNTKPGWDIVTDAPITVANEGYYHSTLAAGVAAASINNLTGGSGVANCWLLPINIGETPTISDMHDAIVWAADHGVRVVNASWDGAFSSIINEAGAYLKVKTGGMLFMSGVNGRQSLNYPNHPDIYAVAMTDELDTPRSAYGDHIDFTAPGWEIYSTTTNSSYEIDSGTSYSAPLVAGIAAWIMSVNPDLKPDAIEQILKDGSIDLGEKGWDQSFGWGRVDFGMIAGKTFATLPISRITAARDETVKIAAAYLPGARYRLFRSDALSNSNFNWLLVSDAKSEQAGEFVLFGDPQPAGKTAFYKVEITLPSN